MADAKAATRKVELFEKNYEKLWRKKDDSIPQFVPIRPRASGGTTVGQEGQVPYVPVDTGPLPFAVRTPKPILALSAPRMDLQIEEIEKNVRC